MALSKLLIIMLSTLLTLDSVMNYVLPPSESDVSCPNWACGVGGGCGKYLDEHCASDGFSYR